MAVCALVVATLMALNQTRDARYMRERLLDDQIEVMASGIALQVQERIGQTRFDAVPGTDPNTFTQATAFGNNRRCDVLYPIQSTSPYVACTDLDDFDGMQWEAVPFDTREGTFMFEVSAEVTYLDDSLNPTTTRTRRKRVSVLVRDRVLTGQTPLLRLPVTLPRVYAPVAL